MAFKEYVAAAKEILGEVNSFIKVAITTVGLSFIAFTVYKQATTIVNPTPTAVIETLCGAEVIDSLNIASKLADPATNVVISQLVIECQQIKPPEESTPTQPTPDPAVPDTTKAAALLDVYSKVVNPAQ